jgi:hypothetical protein
MVSEDLTVMLSAVVPNTASQSRDLENSVRTTIIEPAINLAHELHLATKVYSVEWPFLEEDGMPDLAACDCLNLATGGRRLAVPPGKKSQGRRLKYLFDVSPGLYAEDVGGAVRSAPRVLFKPLILLHDGERGVETMPTTLSWLSSEQTATPSRPGPAPAENYGSSKSKVSPCKPNPIEH